MTSNHTPDMDAPKLAAFYGRVSGRDEESLGTQLTVALETAAKDGYVIPDDPEFRYSDYNVTGKRSDRREFERLLKRIEDPAGPPFTRLYIRSRKRLGRWSDPRRSTYYEVRIADKGVFVRYCDQERLPDFGIGMRREDVGFYIADTVEIANTSADHQELVSKFRARKRELVIQGFYPGGRAPYGYMLMEVDPSTKVHLGPIRYGQRTRSRKSKAILVRSDDGSAEVVAWIFQQVIAGKSFYRIGLDLMERGTPTPSAQTKIWHPSTIATIVRWPIYMGELIWGYTNESPLEPVDHTVATLEGDAPIIYRGFVKDPIVSRETHEQAQRALDSDRWRGSRRSSSPKYLLTGRVFCAHCGVPLNGQLVKRSGSQWMYYQHPYFRHSQRSPCVFRQKGVRGDVLEPAVLAHVRNLLTDEKLEECVRSELKTLLGPEGAAEHERQLGVLEDEYRSLEARNNNFTTAIAIATDPSVIARFTEELQALSKLRKANRDRKTALLQRRLEQNRIAEQRFTVLDDAASLVAVLDEGDFTQRRIIIEETLSYVEYDFTHHQAELALKLIK